MKRAAPGSLRWRCSTHNSAITTRASRPAALREAERTRRDETKEETPLAVAHSFQPRLLQCLLVDADRYRRQPPDRRKASAFSKRTRLRPHTRRPISSGHGPCSCSCCFCMVASASVAMSEMPRPWDAGSNQRNASDAALSPQQTLRFRRRVSEGPRRANESTVATRSHTHV